MPPRLRPLARDFYARPALEVAPDLLGHILVSEVDGVRRAGRIVEVEAYVGPEDLACHASKGRTNRTEVMFGPPGRAYVFTIYGMYPCFNVVTDREGHPAAVLVRAVEPVVGVERSSVGPGCVCLALGITRGHYGADLTSSRDGVWIAAGDRPPARVLTTPRVNVDYAGPWAEKPWRFLEDGSPYVSRPRPYTLPRRPARASAGRST